jgi:AcrR family transcriptional regulator
MRSKRTFEPSGPDASTRQRILMAAERLFARDGIERTTMRATTREAGTNLAAVNYHFGSKDGLIKAVFDDLARATARSRLDRLAELRARKPGRPLPIRDIIDTFMAPYIGGDGTPHGALLVRLILQHRATPTPVTRRIISTHFDRLAEIFIEALAETAPHLDRTAASWRYYCAVGAIVFATSERAPGGRLEKISGGAASAADRDQLVTQLTDFLIGGMNAPSSTRARAVRVPARRSA